MATHAPITGAPTRAPFIPAPPAAITRVLSRFDRDQLAGFIAVAIDLLDVADGDPDLEDDDPAGGAVDDQGEDEPWVKEGHCLALPIYALDQTAGPINEHEATRDYNAAMMGLVRSPTGGWRKPINKTPMEETSCQHLQAVAPTG